MVTIKYSSSSATDRDFAQGRRGYASAETREDSLAVPNVARTDPAFRELANVISLYPYHPSAQNAPKSSTVLSGEAACGR